MVKMSTLKQIKALEKERASVIEKMLYQKLMVPGAYKEVYCRCGKKNCWCYSGMGHPYSRITISSVLILPIWVISRINPLLTVFPQVKNAKILI